MQAKLTVGASSGGAGGQTTTQQTSTGGITTTKGVSGTYSVGSGPQTLREPSE